LPSSAFYWLGEAKSSNPWAFCALGLALLQGLKGFDMSTEIKDNVQQIVNNIKYGFPDEYGQDDQPYSAFDYLQDALDIEYIVNSKREYLGARVLVAFGGPNIWINTRTKQVEGYWWGDSCVMSYNTDAMDLDSALSELYNC
jgi:hypothetical protein